MLRTAQIGVGYWGPNLLRNLQGHPGCDVRRVVDVSPERRDYVAGLYPAVTLSDRVEDVFEDPELDAVVIATPVASHYDLACRALDAGLHILVEKPMAVTVEEIDDIEARAQRAGRVAMVGHTFLFNSAVRYLKQLIDSGELGQVRYIYSQRLNLGRIRNDVDALWNLAPHDVSIIQYLLGDLEPVSIRRQGMAYIQEDIDDVVFLHMEYPDRIMAHVHVSWLDPHKVRRMTVVGDKKMAVYDDIAENKITLYDKGIEPRAVLGERMDYDQAPVMRFDYRSGDVLLPRIDWVEPLKAEIDHFVQAAGGHIACMTGPAHAREVVRILSCPPDRS